MTTANNDIFLGQREIGDYLLEEKRIDRHPDNDSKFLKILDFTDPISLDSDYKITRVEIVDYKGEETGAVPQVITGGPGFSYVTIEFVSQRGYGIHFHIKIYGKRTIV